MARNVYNQIVKGGSISKNVVQTLLQKLFKLQILYCWIWSSNGQGMGANYVWQSQDLLFESFTDNFAFTNTFWNFVAFSIELSRIEHELNQVFSSRSIFVYLKECTKWQQKWQLYYYWSTLHTYSVDSIKRTVHLAFHGLFFY